MPKEMRHAVVPGRSGCQCGNSAADAVTVPLQHVAPSGRATNGLLRDPRMDFETWRITRGVKGPIESTTSRSTVFDVRSLFIRDRDNRLMVAMTVGALLILPASGLRLACVGASCASDESQATGPVPFCSLPTEIRRRITTGFYDGRSPELLGVTTTPDAVSVDGSGVAWPSLDTDIRVPLVFAGDGVATGPLPAGTQIDRVAPTLADLINFNRPYPMLERTDPIRGVVSSSPPRLIVEVGLKGIGTPDLEAAPNRWPTIARLMRDGAGTLEASVDSLPLDPTAVLTTMGTGSPPSQHGITGTLIRDAEGRMVRAWSPDAPVSAIATLADDLDERTDQRSLVGLVADATTDRGLVGGDWYVDHDRDVRAFSASTEGVVVRALRSIGEGFGDDAVPDVLAVVLDGSIRDVDSALGRLVDGISTLVDAPTVFVIAGTGSDSSSGELGSADVEQAVRSSVGGVLEGQVPGGLFVDADRLVAAGESRQDVRDALAELTDANGDPVMADAFLSYSVSFGKYC